MTPPIIHSTPQCYALPRVVFALEEAGAPYSIVLHDNGYFESTFGMSGPQLEAGSVQLFQVNTILRHVARTCAPGALWPSDPDAGAEAESWMDFCITAFREAIIACVQNPSAVTELARVLGVLERRLADRAWLAGDHLTVADIAYAGLALVPPLCAQATADLPRVAAWVAAMLERPAWPRALAAIADARKRRAA